MRHSFKHDPSASEILSDLNRGIVSFLLPGGADAQ